MKKEIVYILLVIVALYACNNNTTSNNSDVKVSDTLAYKYIEVKKRAPDCGGKADSNCTVAKFKYPVFAGKKQLSDTVYSRLVNLFQLSEKPDSNLNSLINKFIANYLDDKQDNGQDTFYSLDCYGKVLRQDSSLTIVQVGGYVFSGGAHSSEFTGYVNWNTSKDKTIEIEDLVAPANIQKFIKIAESIFRKDEKLADTASLANEYFFKDGIFTLANNFYLTAKGLMFFYNQYEIKSYAAGTTELLVPYDKIKTLLLPNTVVTQYLK